MSDLSQLLAKPHLKKINREREQAKKARDYILQLPEEERKEREEEAFQKYLLEYKKKHREFPLNRPPEATLMAFMIDKITKELNL